MNKINFVKTHRHLYQPPAAQFVVVDVPAMHFLMIDGHGDPNHEPAYAQAVETLYALAYRAKFLSKAALERDYVVPPLEGLWWADDMASFTERRDKRTWDWTMQIMQPEWITADMIQQVRADVAQKKALPALDRVRFERFHEGAVVQTLHIGPYDDEGPILAQLHGAWLAAHGYTERGKHHEIYLSDPRRTAAAKLKTVLRQPIRQRENASVGAAHAL